VGPRGGLNAVVKRKIPFLCRELIILIAVNYTDLVKRHENKNGIGRCLISVGITIIF
jgi:hypothetical protein